MATSEKVDLELRPQFGNRNLTDESQVFQHNAWDNVEWDDVLEEEAKSKVDSNSKEKVKPELQDKYNAEADLYWDKFYGIHTNRFFKDRHWLYTEFAELFPESVPPVSTLCADVAEEYPGQKAFFRILEVGCGVGNTVFPVVKAIGEKSIYVYGCDFSSKAIDILKEDSAYDTSKCHAFVCDISDEANPVPFPEASLDVVVMIFVLSALHPDRFAFALNRLSRFLKPGGVLLFRDYGRYDLAQMRFKNGQCLSDNFYVRGDGTRVYFFTQDELRSLFSGAGLMEVQNHTDRRLIVNRGKQLKMYRVWMQCKYSKPSSS